MPIDPQHGDNEPKAPREAPGQRLRIDPEKVEAARRRLAHIDETVFAVADKHAAGEQSGRVAEIVAALFADG